MKKIVLCSVLMLGISVLMAQNHYITKNNKSTVSGTSSLHEWTSEIREVNFSGDLTINNNVLEGIQNLTVEVPVKSIVSSKGSIMDNKTYDALKSNTDPKIIFKLTKVNSITPAAADHTANVTGNLTVAGVTKPVTLEAKLKVGASVEVNLNYALKMTTFGIKPPVALLGTLKTGDEVKLKFNLTLTKT